jgi:hypothetical protein
MECLLLGEFIRQLTYSVVQLRNDTEIDFTVIRVVNVADSRRPMSGPVDVP